ncbi:MAG TPA: helix-turn-helix transcriptional regulator [Rickettsiales bacterium]|nr:helix-turn-helix transcriptional regulator [Rickettsiales bacterium]
MQADDYVDIGRYLRDVRESLKVTVEQAARDLHIRPKYLHDLEKGDLSGLPGKAYIRGYVKNYAEYLRLNADEVVAAYEKLFGGHHSQKFFVPTAHTHQQLPSRNIVWFGILGIAAVYGYWYFGIYEKAAVPDKTVETKLDNEVPALPDAWASCLDSEQSGCFIELNAAIQLPDMKPPEVFNLTVPADAAPVPPAEPSDNDE